MSDSEDADYIFMLEKQNRVLTAIIRMIAYEVQQRDNGEWGKNLKSILETLQ